MDFYEPVVNPSVPEGYRSTRPGSQQVSLDLVDLYFLPKSTNKKNRRTSSTASVEGFGDDQGNKCKP